MSDHFTSDHIVDDLVAIISRAQRQSSSKTHLETEENSESIIHQLLTLQSTVTTLSSMSETFTCSCLRVARSAFHVLILFLFLFTLTFIFYYFLFSSDPFHDLYKVKYIYSCLSFFIFCQQRKINGTNVGEIKLSNENAQSEKLPTKFEDLQARLPNLPIFGWLSMKNIERDGNKSCSQYPDILNIEYRNKYWQIFKTYDANNTREATYHLYGAYLG